MTNKKCIRFDWALKDMLRQKANFDILESFLSSLLKENITIDSLGDAEKPLCLMGRDSQGQQIIIQLQTRREGDYLKRHGRETSQARADNDARLITVDIVYFPISDHHDYVYRGKMEFRGLHTLNVVQLNDKKLGAVFPEWYVIDVARFDDSIREELDEWLYYIKHGEIRSEFTSPGIVLASQRLDPLAMNPVERKSYESYLEYLALEQEILSRGMAEGWAEGWAQGWAEGRAAGRAEAQAEVKAEVRSEVRSESDAQWKRETARRLLANGVKIEDIVKAVGLSIDEISKR